MLDKSIPYVDVLMRREQGQPINEYGLPEGFRFVLFQKGDEKEWARIETSVLEFKDEADALSRFQKDYMPFISELEKRCLFIESPQGEKIATSTAWWCHTDQRRDPWLNWVAVMPQYQRLGLGKAIVSKAMRLMLELEGDRVFYLHTQTWSHRAIKIYELLGFSITDEKNLHKYSNEHYEKAMEILRKVYNHTEE